MSATEQRTEKRCTKCDVVKPLSAFSSKNPDRSQIQSWCKECYRAWMAEYRRGSPARRERDRQRGWAHNSASIRLRERHRIEFDALYAEELAKAGFA